MRNSVTFNLEEKNAVNDTEFGFLFLLNNEPYDVTIRVSNDTFTIVERDGLHPSMDSLVLMQAQELLMDSFANAPLSDILQ